MTRISHGIGTAVGVALTLALGGFAAAAPPPSRGDSSSPARPGLPEVMSPENLPSTSPFGALDIVRRLPGGADYVAALESAQRVDLEEWAYAEPIRDLDRDGLEEVVVTRSQFSMGLGQPQGAMDATVTIRDGASGRPLWTRRWKDTDGIYPVGARVGPDGTNGVIVLEWLLSDNGEETELVFHALDARGRTQWTKSYFTRVTYGPDFVYAVDGLLSAGLFDGTGGKETDLLIGTGHHVAVSYTYTVTDLSMHVVDGADAQETAHEGLVHSVNFHPYPWTTKDLSGDGLDDYVVTRAGPAVVEGPEGEPTITTTGVLSARRGDAGAQLWEQALDLGWFAWVTATRDITLGEEPDVFVSVYDFDEGAGLIPLLPVFDEREDITLLDGASGRLMWTRPGFWHLVPGNIDTDGGPDVMTFDTMDKEQSIATKVRAYATSGDLLFKRTYETEHVASQFGWSMWGVSRAGDVHPDRVEEVAIYHGGGAGPATASYDTFIVDGRDGRLHLLGGEELIALGEQLDASGTDLLAKCPVPPGNLHLEGIAGTDGSTSWVTQLDFSLPVPQRTVEVWPMAARLTRGTGHDVVLNVRARQSSHLVVLNGASGRVLWALQLTGVPNELSTGDAGEPGRCSE